MNNTDYSTESPTSEPIVGYNQSSGQASNRKRLLLVVALIVILIAGAIVGLQMLKKNDGAVTTIRSVSANGNITPTGVSPSTIQVKKGQQVTLTNQDVRPHRLVADQESLPGFDTVDVLNQGDSYTYIFETSGTFRFYDPADPKTYVGTVTVE